VADLLITSDHNELPNQPQSRSLRLPEQLSRRVSKSLKGKGCVEDARWIARALFQKMAGVRTPHNIAPTVEWSSARREAVLYRAIQHGI
jgi:hypothetical protein